MTIVFGSKTLTGGGQWTDAVKLSGWFSLSISGIWAGTVTVQRRTLDPSIGDWKSVETFTANTEKRGLEPEINVEYRVGIDSGDYTSGTALVRLSQ